MLECQPSGKGSFPGFGLKTKADPLQQSGWDVETTQADLNALNQPGFETKSFQTAKTLFEMSF